ncbi:MAG: hypothetical protein F4X82_00665 [Candidatus Spechtbacteria bacterium SB0662_bin_43]|uniref:Glycosyltransferase RgtA/B/C/D-like domain-containing protein n=1 Tax=Candidatus Spechtbacteria bacterium SB0662_bin_43 TaxID=2604897 RepID=A0A845DAF2_9BACT|nr:hypothetical protein [Candidatus Spechtbacteria bacterium SB0662_bin_43]
MRTLKKDRSLIKKYWALIILAGIFAVGIFIRVHAIETLPLLRGDEAVVGMDAIIGSQETDEANEQSGFFTAFVAFAFSLFGVSIPTLKLASIVFGSLTILSTYILAKQLLLFAQYNPLVRARLSFSQTAIESSALLSAGIVASNILHIAFSRNAYDTITAPFFLTLALASIWYALRTKHRSAFIGSGIVWGIGCYASPLFTVSLLMCVGVLALVFLFHNTQQRNKRIHSIHASISENEKINIGIFNVTLLVVLIPLFIKGFSFFAQNETTFLHQPDVFSSLWQNISTLVQSFFEGSPFFQEPFVALPLIPLFALGVLYLIWTLYNAIHHKNNALIVAQLTLLCAPLFLLLPALFTTTIDPGRILIIIPLLAIIASYGFLLITRLIFPTKQKRRSGWAPSFLVALFFLAGIFFIQNHSYTTYVSSATQSHPSYTTSQHINSFIQQQHDTTHIYLVVNTQELPFVPYPKSVRDTNTEHLPISGYSTLFLQHTNTKTPKKTTYISHTEIPHTIHTPAIIIPLEDTPAIREILRKEWDIGIATQYDSFWTYTIQ